MCNGVGEPHKKGAGESRVPEGHPDIEERQSQGFLSAVGGGESAVRHLGPEEEHAEQEWKGSHVVDEEQARRSFSEQMKRFFQQLDGTALL